MDQDIAIEVSHVSKSFKIYLDKSNTFKDKVLFSKRNQYESREVLKDVSFTVKKGESVGLIGHNGCGKSTTLKLLTRIISPDNGTININGRVSSLLELGAGFHPDMSGRDNIYNNASIFGLNKKEIDRRIDDIIAFSELEDFIDNPVRTYSSGMYMRLAFSVAINVDADILLIDEILAVGDANFQYKCLQKMKQIKQEGTTIIVVSHSTSQIEQLCDRSIWLNEGEIVYDDVPYVVHMAYLDYMAGQRKVMTEQEKKAAEEAKKLDLKVISVDCFDDNKKHQTMFTVGQNINISMHYTIKKECEGYIRWSVISGDNVVCYKCNKRLIKFSEKGVMRITLNNIELLKGHYVLHLDCYTDEGALICSIGNVCLFDIVSEKGEDGIYRMDNSWGYY